MDLNLLRKGLSSDGLGLLAGAGAGAYFGSAIGIAALGTAIAGTLPVAIVGGTIGYLVGREVARRKVTV